VKGQERKSEKSGREDQEEKIRKRRSGREDREEKIRKKS
jgi:hypothetical protein